MCHCVLINYTGLLYLKYAVIMLQNVQCVRVSKIVYYRLTLQSRPQVSFQKQPAIAESQQLQARLSSLGFLLLGVGGGGNCQFRAFAHQLLGDQKQHTSIRQEAY